jgi:hypothetical protein
MKRWKREPGRGNVALGGGGLWHFLPHYWDGLVSQFSTLMQCFTLPPPTLQTQTDE